MRLSRDLLQEVHRHGEEAYPHECCGLLLGRIGGDGVREALRVRRARNLDAERAHDRYLLDPADRLSAEREAEAAGLSLVGIYHSHPDHDAYFSQTDLERSEEYQWGEPWVPPAFSYLVLSVRDGRPAACRAFQVVDGRAVEEPLEITEPARNT